MQNLSQPIWMRTYAWNGVGRIEASRIGSKLSKLASTSCRLASARPRLRANCGSRVRFTSSTSSGSRASWPVPQTISTCGRALADDLLVLLGHAAENADHLLGIFLLMPDEAAESGIDLLLGMFADAARVEQNDVGVDRLVDQFVALPAQTADDELAIEHVHLAADGFDVEFLGHMRFGG